MLRSSRSERLEAWAAGEVPVATLRDAARWADFHVDELWQRAHSKLFAAQ
jgi:hypothetical protein